MDKTYKIQILHLRGTAARALLCLLPLLAVVVLSCNSSSTEPDIPQNAVSIKWSPLEAQNREIYRPTIRITGGSGFKELNVQRADWDTTMAITGTNPITRTIEEFFDFERELLPKELPYTVTVTQVSGERDTEVFAVQLDYINQKPEIQIDVGAPQRLFGGGEIPIEISFSDDYGLGSAFLEIEGVRYDFDVAGKTAKHTTINHSLSSTGNIEWYGEVVDDEGLVNSLSGEFYNVPKFNFEIGARGFYNKEIDRDLSLRIRNLELGEEYELSADNNGVIQKELFEGPYIIFDVEGQYYPIGRMKVSRDIYGDDRQFNPGEEFTYIVTGIERTPWLINLTKDLNSDDYYIETIDISTNPYTGEDFVENISRMMRDDFIVVPRRSEVKKIVFNYGNPDWPEGFDFWGDHLLHPDFDPNDGSKTLPGDARYPPGHTFTQEEIDNFNAFMDDMITKVYESDIGGMNPYRIEIIKDTAENLTQYFAKGPPYGLSLKPNVHYIAGNGHRNRGVETGEEDFFGSNAKFIEFSAIMVYGKLRGTNDSNTSFSAERRFAGSTAESRPPICSVRDRGSSTLHQTTDAWYCSQTFTTPDGSSLKPIDVLGDNMSVHIGAWSEFQPSKNYFSKGDNHVRENMWNTSSSDEGFNVWLVGRPQ